MPREPTAAQSSTLGHETPKKALNGWPWLPPGGKGIRLVADQEPGGPVGFVETATSPLLSTAAQRETVGQEMPVIGTDGPVLTSRQCGAPAFASVLERTLPPAFPAKQRPSSGQSTAPRSPGPPGVPISLQTGATPAGLVDKTIRPLFATAIQNVRLVQETARNSSDPSSWTSAKEIEAESGSLTPMILPPSFPPIVPDPSATVTQNVGVAARDAPQMSVGVVSIEIGPAPRRGAAPGSPEA